MKHFQSNETSLAFVRWKDVTQGDYTSFMEYLGMATFLDHGATYRRYPLPPFSIGVPSTVKKMDALLSPHWYALTKAYLAVEAGNGT